MNTHRSAALVLATCAAGLSLAACSAGITSSATSSPAASSRAASRSAAASPASGSGSAVSVGGSIGSFPIPPKAQVVENATENKQTVIILSSVSPSEVSSFYTVALPRAGYKIASNSLATLNSNTGAAIEFTGHGYKGTIGAVSNLPTTGVSLGGVSTKNFVGITLAPR